MSNPLTNVEKQILLRLGREAMECGVSGKKLPPIDQSLLTPDLLEKGASFVTLTIGSNTRLRLHWKIHAFLPWIQVN